MIQAVLFDVGGTLHTGHSSEALAEAFARRLIARLAIYDIKIDTPYDVFAKELHHSAEAYKSWSEKTLLELPAPRIWNEFYLARYNIGEETLAPIAEELSFLYDYERVCNKRRAHLKETMQSLREQNVRMGVVSNIISTSFVPHILKEYGIDTYMECVVMSSAAGRRKPDKGIFELAMREMHVSREETAYVGDTLSRDVLGARNTGLALMIQIRNPAIAHRDVQYAGSGLAPDYLIDELHEVPELIRAYNLSNH